jgi:hypothetical protein
VSIVNCRCFLSLQKLGRLTENQQLTAASGELLEREKHEQSLSVNFSQDDVDAADASHNVSD